MKIIISTEKFSRLKTRLQKCNSFGEISESLLKVGYFSYFEIQNKRKQSLLKLCEELEFYRELRHIHPQFPEKINVYVMHNEFFYEEEGISKLDHWTLYRNVISNFIIALDKDVELPECINDVITRVTLNNFSKNDFLEIVATIE